MTGLSRAERPGWNDAFANYCLVLARAASQFYRFARFAPDQGAVVAADVTLASVARALAERRVTPSAQTVVYDSEGVIAWSGGTASLTTCIVRSGDGGRWRATAIMRRWESRQTLDARR